MKYNNIIRKWEPLFSPKTECHTDDTDELKIIW